MEDEVLTIRQVSQQLDIPTSTVRYYCNHGLIPNVRRTRTGYRVFTPKQVDWLQTMIWMRDGGFTVEDLKKYVSLCRAGNQTIEERKAMLVTKQHQIRQEIDELERRMDYLRQREEILEAILKTGKTVSDQWV